MNKHNTKIVLKTKGDIIFDSWVENEFTWLNRGDTIEIDKLPISGTYPPNSIYKVDNVSRTNKVNQGVTYTTLITVEIVPKS